MKRWFSLVKLFLGHSELVFWRRQWEPTPVLLPGKSHGRRSLVSWSPWGHEESDTTERLHFHFSLSCIGEGNGNPLQCSCLENPRDVGAWWAAVCGVARVGHDWRDLAAAVAAAAELVFRYFFFFIFPVAFLATGNLPSLFSPHTATKKQAAPFSPLQFC